MYQLRIYLLITFFGFLSVGLQAQFNPFGNSRIENFHHFETGGGEQNWDITQDHRGIIYVANNDNGILEFDGSNWRTIPGTEYQCARSLVTGQDGVVYAGMEGDFGRLEPDLHGNMRFTSLADSITRKLFPDITIWKSYYGNGRVFFCATEAIFAYTPATGKLQHLETSENAFLTYLIGEDLYSSDYGTGLTKHNGNSFVLLPGGGYFKEKSVFGIVAMDPEHLLVGMFEEGLVLYSFTKEKVDSTFLDAELREELSTAGVTSLMLQDHKIFVGTMEGGLYILDRQGKVIEVINQREGLINETLTQVYADPDSQTTSAIWVAHFEGISRIEINHPFRMIPLGRGRTDFGGRDSDDLIFDISEFNGKLYVATINGLYHRDNGSGDTRFRPFREISEPIHDLQLINPSPGKEFLLASGREHIYVLDQNMRIKKLAGRGKQLLIDAGRPDIFYTADTEFTGFQYINEKWEQLLRYELDAETSQMCMDKLASVWLSTSSGLLRLDSIHSSGGPLMVKEEVSGLLAEDFLRLYSDPEGGDLLVGTSRGFYRFDYIRDSMVFDTIYNSILPEGNNQIFGFYRGADGLYWFSFEDEADRWTILGAIKTSSGMQVIHDRPFKALPYTGPVDVFHSDSQKQLWFERANMLFQFIPALASEEKGGIRVLLRQVGISGDSIVFHGTHYATETAGHRITIAEQSEEEVPRMNFKYRDIEFHWSSPYFKSRRQVSYSYYLDGFSTEWSQWERNRSAKFTNLPHGRYEILVKARNVYGDESPPAIYAFYILRPWYATIMAISLYVILLAALILSVIRYTRNLRRRAEELERKNMEIEQQKKELENLNEEITSQRDEIESQRDSIAVQKELIDRQKTAMTDSIHYAKRIQDAVLPAKEVMRFLLPKHFIFYRPRDIVSGDFFWVDKKDDTILLAVADCTGHGVPGAFMSMLGISLLNEISSKYMDHPINEIMDELRDRVIASLGQTGDKYETRDGIEMGLLAINTKTRETHYTGANMDLYTFQKGELVVVKGDRMPVGIHSEGNTFFTLKDLKLDRGDTLYLFSDGYPDQFGGKERKKFGTASLKGLLTEVQHSIMHDQKAALDKEFDSWKGEEDQIDDVLMVGIKL